jgi:5-bromo-4-chloroindolyl phosphate hydrolysis protein
MDASLIANNIDKNYYEISKKGYYWIVAQPKFSKTSDFYGKDIPVAVEKYSYILPVSSALQYGI